ncbi:type I-F CRISPR-associated protein Csy2 [Balneatrix alpica]|uniref:Type I-F CRISPR-associated protein Csy2 n=1 Tax=Balneatrix alpica TaxID=75684 RepID=A0ABV5Z7Q4_9GAMM|nr:type I-F CRISPR-associated protein Csy2 [Balneatrix alpica]
MSETGLLILPRVRVQNANCISSPMTWGFPSITAFTGLMAALERKVHEHTRLEFLSVGVICHHFAAQVTSGGYTRTFCLTRNPVDKDGSTAAIVEEGRAHLDITLVFGVGGTGMENSEEQRQQAARYCAEALATLRIAGGSVLPALPGTPGYYQQPTLKGLDDDPDKRAQEFRRLRRQWLPGFALVCRDDLLTARLQELQQTDPEASRLDAWLDLSRLHIRPRAAEPTQEQEAPPKDKLEWEVSRPPGWLVPIPIGFAALSPLHPPGEVANARDMTTPFRFVESLYSIGQWLSPHRLQSHEQLLWYSVYDDSNGLYRCQNDYALTHNHDFA